MNNSIGIDVSKGKSMIAVIGKTRSVMETHGYENVYQVTNYAHPFDGYPIMLPCRYNDRVVCYTTVYIVSNIPIEKQYPNVQIDEPETWDAFRRRITDATEMLPDDTEIPF